MEMIKFENHNIDVLNQDGSKWDGKEDAWFIPKQIAEAIGAKNPDVYATKILNRNPEKFEGFRSTTRLVGEAGERKINIINEHGLYMFLMVSNLPQAIQFQRKVSELIKEVRKNNINIVSNSSLPRNYKEALISLLGQVEVNETLQLTIQEQQPKVELFNLMISANNNQDMNEVARSLKWGRNKLFDLLRDKEILMWNNLPYQNSGYFTVHEAYKNGQNFPKTLVTPKGLGFVGNIVREFENKELISV